MLRLPTCRLRRLSLPLVIVFLVASGFAFTTSGQSVGQNPPISTLTKEQKAELENLNNRAAGAYGNGDLTTAVKLWKQGLDRATTLADLGFVARFLSNLGAVYCALGQNDKALECSNRALAIEEQIGNHPDIAETLINLGSVYTNLGQNDKALGYYNRALDIKEKDGKQADIASCLLGLGADYSALGQNDKALACYTRALSIREKLGNQADIADTLSNLGLVYLALGDNDKALDDLTLAHSTFEKIGNRGGIANTLNNLGNFYTALGKTDKILESFTGALSIYEKIGNPADIALALDNLGAAYSSLGQNDKALDYYTSALTTYEMIGNPTDIGRTLGNVGGVYYVLGQYDKAFDYFTRALAIKEKVGNQAKIADAMIDLGNVNLALSRMDAALDAYTRSLTLYDKIGRRADIAAALNNIGMVYRSLGHGDRALDYFMRANAIQEKIGNQADIAATLNNLGLAYGDLGQKDKGLSYFNRALTKYENIGNHADIALALDNLGTADEDLGRLDEAEKQYAESRRLRELVSLQVSDPSQVGALQETYYHFYERYARLRLRRNLAEEALEMLEAGRGQGLARQIDLTERGDVTHFFTVAEKAGLLDKTRLLRNAQVQFRRAQQQVENAGEADRQERTKRAALAGEASKNAEREYDQFKDGLLARYPQLREMAENRPAKFTRLRTLPRDHPGTLYLEWGVVNDKTTLLFALGDKDALTPLQLPVGEKELRAIAQRWREALDAAGGRGPVIANPDNRVKAELDETLPAKQAFQALLGEAWKLGLLAPGRYKRLVFVGSGPILEMPLAAMIDPTGKRIIESYSISNAFSLSSYFYQPNVVAQTKTLFCVADPTGPAEQAQPVTDKPVVAGTGRSAFRAGFLPLPGARTEGEAVAALFAGSELLIGPDAREQRVTDDMKDFQILHFGTHGYLVPNSPQSSGLVLAEEPVDAGTGTVIGTGMGADVCDGLLTVRKIVNLSAVWKRSMAAQLAVLSACDTGRGVSQGGDGLMGLAWAFRAAGCPTVVASQWSVDDAATKEWMLTFYGALKAGKPKDDAVQAAMLAVKKTHPSPFYWAAFELIGDASPIALR